MIDRIKRNWNAIRNLFISVAGTIFGLVTLVLTFFTWDDLGIKRVHIKLIILFVVLFVSIIISVLCIVCKRRIIVAGDHNRGVVACYGDLFEIAFSDKYSGERIVVIPVNRCFDVSCESNLIAESSIHGKWLKRYISSEEQRNEVNIKIQNSLQNYEDVCQLDRSTKQVGNLKRYPAGTVVELPGINSVTFYLLAVAELDGQLKARCSENDFYQTLQGLIDYYDTYGQTRDIYVPIMGDHIIRPTRKSQDILGLMISIFKFNKQNLHGKVHIVVYKEMKNSVSILNI